MNNKILLNENKAKTSTNIDNTIGVEVKRTQALLPYNNVNHIVNQDAVYKSELDACNNYRLIFTIKPLCSNVLFNSVSEIIYKEGSDDTIVIPTIIDGDKSNVLPNDIFKLNDTNNVLPKSKESIYTVQCIRDTEYSHIDIGGCVYHCGWDIMNNHMMRNIYFGMISQRRVDTLPSPFFDRDKIIINGEGEIIYNIDDTFNTIRDYQRYENGDAIEGLNINKWVNSDPTTYSTDYKLNPHAYQFDSILSFTESVEQNVINENGWYGFTNPSNIEIPNYFTYNNDGTLNKSITLNKCMNNNKPCEFIDFYPDRSLYSFNPKINKYRSDKIEKNWEYCLTYPHQNHYEHDYIKGDGVNGLLVKNIVINESENGSIRLTLTSAINHNLKNSDFIFLYYQINGVGDMNKSSKATNINVIDKTTFSVNYNDILPLNVIPNDAEELRSWKFRFTRVVNNFEVEYYFRIFKKMPNLNYLKNNIDDVDIDDSIINEYNKFDFNNELSKCGFSQTIYGDYNTQIVYTDTILTSGIKDNIGRPLSELYLTIVKNNKGYKEWYYDKDYTNPDIEYSRAFGKITSGLSLSNINTDYNIHKIHNITKYVDKEPLNIPPSGKTLEWMGGGDNTNGLTIKQGDFSDDSFYGDIVEFDRTNIAETTLEIVYHRFNTAQREFERDGDYTYRDIIHDEIYTDDYDFTNENGDGNSGFSAREYTFNEMLIEGRLQKYPINLFPEGYYYKPHYKITLNEFSNNIQQAYDINIRYIFKSYDNDKKEVTIKTPINYECEVNDKVKIIEKGGKNIYEGEINNVENSLLLTIKMVDANIIIDKIMDGDVLIYRKNPYIPNYATYLGDDSGRYLWRDVINKSMLTPLNETYGTPFTNNALYKYGDINFYLRRQDPFGVYGLQYKGNVNANPSALLTIVNSEEDDTLYEYINTDNETTTC